MYSYEERLQKRGFYGLAAHNIGIRRKVREYPAAGLEFLLKSL